MDSCRSRLHEQQVCQHAKKGWQLGVSSVIIDADEASYDLRAWIVNLCKFTLGRTWGVARLQPQLFGRDYEEP